MKRAACRSWAGSVLGVAVLLNGCGTHEPPTPVQAARCLPVSGATAATLSATVPANGFLRILARPDGVSIVATLGPEIARSPIDRYGSVTFLHPARAAAPIRADRSLAAAAKKVAPDDWQRAFDRYLDAAREFDALDAFRAAEARHAMAEIAYGPLARQDAAFWLARAALAGYGGRPP